MCLWLKILLLVSIINISFGARILGIFYCPSYSHQIVFHPIYKELSQRGHELIVITPNPLNDPSLTNLTEIDVSYLYPKFQKTIYEGFLNNPQYRDKWDFAMNLVNVITDELWRNEEFKKLYQNAENEKFDLILVEALSPIMAAFGHLFNAPVIGIYSLEASLDQYIALGGIVHPALYGAMFLDFTYPLSIWEKLENVYNFLWHKIHTKYIQVPAIDKQTRRYLGNDFPSISELEKNISMLFINKNIWMNTVRPMPPSMIQLEFMHVQEPKPLPKELEEIMNNSTQGVVYFSLGSNVKSSTMPPHIIKSFTEGLSALPYTVLWKWETDNVPEVGKNVITRKWFPQQDILAHPNIKVFVTQGGLQSSEEAMSRAVPVVGIPVIADQKDNVMKLSKLGVGVHLPLDDLTTESLKQAIIEVAENKKYSIKMKELRRVVMDQPMTGLERAVWWSEYVIRNKGAPVLRSAMADVPLYEYLLLDVIFTIFLALFAGWFTLKKIVFWLNNTRKRKVD